MERTPAESALLDLICTRALKRGKFTLASGAESTYFIDGKMMQISSAGANFIGEVLYERTRNLRCDAIGGLEVGAVPLATAAVFAYHMHGGKMEGFWVRNKPKDHGTKHLIEGNVKSGDRVVVVDDVITTGSSTIKAIEAVRGIGCEVVAVFTLVDRLAGAREQFDRLGIKNYTPIFTIRDLGVT